MSQPELDFFIRRGIALKIETTENTDAAPSPSTDGVLLINGESGTEYDKKERVVDRPFFTGNSYSVSNKRAFIEGDFEVFAPATPGQAATQYPACDALLQIAGMAAVLNAGAKTTKYNPITDSIKSATAHWWHTDTYLAVTGARNDIKSIRMEIGAICTGKAHVQGNYQTVDKQTMPTITTYNTVPVTATYDVSECYVSDNGAAEVQLWGKYLEVVFGSKLGTKEYTTVKRNKISDRKASFSFRVAKADLADFNPWTARDQQHIITFRMRTYETGTFGRMNGLFTELAIRGQIDTIKEANIDDDLGWDVTGSCIASSAGGDEFYLLFGDDTFAINNTLPNAAAGSYVHALTTSGRADGTVTFADDGGLAGSGITLSAAGSTSGTAVAGTYTGTITATWTHSNGTTQTATYAYSIVIS